MTLEVLDKETALKITRLFHAMETLLFQECKDRDERLLDIKASLDRERLQTELDRLARRHTLDELHSNETPLRRTKGR